MTLSWGSHPPEPPKPPQRGVPAWVIAGVGAVSLAIGISLSVFTQAGPANDEAARSEIETLLRQRHDAVLQRDLDSYMKTIDPARVFLRECEQQRFEAMVRLGIRPDETVLGRVDKWGDYLRVWFDTRDGWKRAFARNDGARWYISEPTSGELGEDRARDVAGVTVRYRAVEDDLVSAIADELPGIIDLVKQHAATPPTQLFSLRVATLTSTNGRCFIAGQAEGYGATTITLRDAGLTPGYNHLDRTTSAVIEHEALHWLQIDRSSDAMQRMDWWLVEGWPFLIANTPPLDARRYAVCVADVPRYDALRFGPARDARPEDVESAYIVASLLVDRVWQRGGDSDYWKLFDAFRPENTDDPFIRGMGADARSFYALWLADARRQYC